MFLRRTGEDYSRIITKYSYLTSPLMKVVNLGILDEKKNGYASLFPHKNGVQINIFILSMKKHVVNRLQMYLFLWYSLKLQTHSSSELMTAAFLFIHGLMRVTPSSIPLTHPSVQLTIHPSLHIQFVLLNVFILWSYESLNMLMLNENLDILNLLFYC